MQKVTQKMFFKLTKRLLNEEAEEQVVEQLFVDSPPRKGRRRYQSLRATLQLELDDETLLPWETVVWSSTCT